MAGALSIAVSPLNFDIEKNSTNTIVRCIGEIRSETCTLFEDTVRSQIFEDVCVVVDLKDVTFIDSSGLGALVSVWSSARKKSAQVDIRWREPHVTAPSEMKIVNFNEAIRKLLRLTLLDRVFGTAE